MIKKREEKQNGFSLIEILISISILIIVLGGVASMAVGVIRASAINKNEVEAQAQNQKQLELAKQYRNRSLIDNNDGTNWNHNLDVDNDFSFSLGSWGIFSIFYNNSKIWPSENTNTRYETKLTSEYVDNHNEILKITAETTWQDRGEERTLSTSTYLTDWFWQ